MNKEFQLLRPLEVFELLKDANGNDLSSLNSVIIYIDHLHDIIKSYQIVIDTAITKNRNVA